MDAQRGIARRMIVGLPPDGLSPAWERDYSAYPPAGVIVFARDFRDLDDLRRLTGRLRELAQPRRIFIAIDEEGGHVSQLAGHLGVPPNALTLGRGAENDDLEWVARVTGTRLRALGIEWVFAPVADIHSEPSNPVIGPRAFGTTPTAVAAHVAVVLRGLRSAGVASCLKHFPGHGDTTIDSHLALPVNDAPRTMLDRRELVPFAANLDADAVMTAHVVFRALDPQHPATLSPAITHDLLRGTLRFGGVSITDALEMKGVAAGHEPFEASRLALEAGCDLLLFAFHDESVRRVRLELAQALADGRIERASFDAARPRLMQLDARIAVPSDAELAAPIASLTPSDWSERLERIVERALVVRGTPPHEAHASAWHVWNAGPESLPPLAAELAVRGIRMATATGEVPLRAELAAHGVPLVEDASRAAVGIAVVATRRTLDPELLDVLRVRCRAVPTIAVGLQNDAFLDALPEAAMTVSVSDATPLTRAVVARRLAALWRGGESGDRTRRPQDSPG